MNFKDQGIWKAVVGRQKLKQGTSLMVLKLSCVNVGCWNSRVITKCDIQYVDYSSDNNASEVSFSGFTAVLKFPELA